MKRLYWQKMPHPAQYSLWLISLLLLSLIYLIETKTIKQTQDNCELKSKAIQATQRAFTAIKLEKIKRLKGFVQPPSEGFDEQAQDDDRFFDLQLDPKASGLLGVLISPITTNSGQLQAKQMSISPIWSAIAIDLIDQAQVKANDCVAIGVSGSFPALNIAVLIALQEAQIQSIVISSVASSMWGANEPWFSWLDMENHLYQQGLFTHKSILASLGGIEDRGKNLTKESIDALQAAITRNHYPALLVTKIEESYERRWLAYQEQAQQKACQIKAYINIGGNAASAGTLWKKAYEPGLNLKPAELKSLSPSYSIMHRFAQAGIPVIHFSRLSTLISQYGISVKALLEDQGDIKAIDQLPSRLRYHTRYDPKLLLLSLLMSVLSLVYLKIYAFKTQLES